ncbi:MAG: c-type cytochrome [Chitinophagales bacterium]|nr:c-type cytochrome [Chitinophagales bacterium]
MKTIILFIGISLLFWTCTQDQGQSSSNQPAKKKVEKKAESSKKVEEGKGVGEITHVDLNNPLVAEMVEKGTSIYELKCASCHKLTDKRVVGPGFAAITERRKPEWIMNMITNVDVMLKEDPEAQALLKECLVRMPNQNLSTEDARSVLEFLYANDGQEVGS